MHIGKRAVIVNLCPHVEVLPALDFLFQRARRLERTHHLRTRPIVETDRGFHFLLLSSCHLIVSVHRKLQSFSYPFRQIKDSPCIPTEITKCIVYPSTLKNLANRIPVTREYIQRVAVYVIDRPEPSVHITFTHTARRGRNVLLVIRHTRLEFQEIGSLIIHIQACAVFLLSVIGYLQLRLFVRVTQRRIISELVISSGNCEGMFVGCRLSVHFVFQIDVRVPAFNKCSVIKCQHFTVTHGIEQISTPVECRDTARRQMSVDCRTSVVGIVENPPVDVLVNLARVFVVRVASRIPVLRLEEHIQPFEVVGVRSLDTRNRTAHRTVIGNLRLAFLSAFCSDQYDTVCRTGTVNSSRSILQYRDILDVVRVHCVQVIQ